MSDVARLAGVSKMTVSRVQSGKVRVTEEKARRVQVAIDQLQYRPNELSRALRSLRSRSDMKQHGELLPVPSLIVVRRCNGPRRKTKTCQTIGKGRFYCSIALRIG